MDAPFVAGVALAMGVVIACGDGGADVANAASPGGREELKLVELKAGEFGLDGDLGELAPNEVVEARYEFEVQVDRNVSIKSIAKSCGCIEASHAARDGKDATVIELLLGWETQSLPGPYSASVSVVFEDSAGRTERVKLTASSLVRHETVVYDVGEWKRLTLPPGFRGVWYVGAIRIASEDKAKPLLVESVGPLGRDEWKSEFLLTEQPTSGLDGARWYAEYSVLAYLEDGNYEQIKEDRYSLDLLIEHSQGTKRLTIFLDPGGSSGAEASTVALEPLPGVEHRDNRRVRFRVGSGDHAQSWVLPVRIEAALPEKWAE